EVVFLPERDADGKFKTRKVDTIGGAQEQPLEYKDAKGRVMVEGQLGRTGRFRFGWFMANVALNLLHLVVWVLVLWLLLEFHFWHAVGQAIVVWMVLMLFVLSHLITGPAP